MSITKATPAARRIAFETRVDLSKLIPRPGFGYLSSSDVLTQKRLPKITNLAKSILNYYKTNPDTLGINIEGKLTKNMVLQALDAANNKIADNSVLNGNISRKPMSGMRKTIAAKMVQSLATAAQYTLFVDLNAGKIKNLSAEISLAEQESSGNKINITDVLIKITAAALVRHPLFNSSVVDNEIIIHDSINVGLAVALQEGLIVPVIRNADQKSLRQISVERQSLVEKARKGMLQPDDYSNGTFTISNMGMYPVDYFTPIINLPENAILGLGRITEKAVPVDGKIEILPMMGVSLTMDHRVIDGAEGAKFLATLKEMLDNPYHICLAWY
jgi:pyruvate dehydrogenase E2 component (dihydrolipoamide acetyltransferase)